MYPIGAYHPDLPDKRSLGMRILALFGALFLTSCATMSDSPKPDPLDEYRAALGAAEKVGSGNEEEGLKNIKSLLADFSKENMSRAAEVYAKDAFLNDTLKTVRGGQAIEDYFVETAESLEYARVKFDDTLRSEDGSYYLRWTMVMKSKVINKGNEIETIGVSHIRFDRDGKVLVHQDYWDNARGVFEHIPVIGSGIRMVKNRL